MIWISDCWHWTQLAFVALVITKHDSNQVSTATCSFAKWQMTQERHTTWQVSPVLERLNLHSLGSFFQECPVDSISQPVHYRFIVCSYNVFLYRVRNVSKYGWDAASKNWKECEKRWTKLWPKGQYKQRISWTPPRRHNWLTGLTLHVVSSAVFISHQLFNSLKAHQTTSRVNSKAHIWRTQVIFTNKTRLKIQNKHDIFFLELAHWLEIKTTFWKRSCELFFFFFWLEQKLPLRFYTSSWACLICCKTLPEEPIAPTKSDHHSLILPALSPCQENSLVKKIRLTVPRTAICQERTAIHLMLKATTFAKQSAQNAFRHNYIFGYWYRLSNWHPSW